MSETEQNKRQLNPQGYVRLIEWMLNPDELYKFGFSEEEKGIMRQSFNRIKSSQDSKLLADFAYDIERRLTDSNQEGQYSARNLNMTRRYFGLDLQSDEDFLSPSFREIGNNIMPQISGEAVRMGVRSVIRNSKKEIQKYLSPTSNKNIIDKFYGTEE